MSRASDHRRAARLSCVLETTLATLEDLAAAEMEGGDTADVAAEITTALVVEVARRIVKNTSGIVPARRALEIARKHMAAYVEISLQDGADLSLIQAEVMGSA